jgi:hypothetical protein
MKKTPQELESRFIGLVRQGVNPREASRVAGISPRTGARILDRVDGGPQIGLPFSGAAQSPPVTPQPGWSSDQPSPPPPREFDPRYHGHAFKNYAAPIAFEGWTLERVRTALALHRMGNFLESSTLALVCLGFAPVMAALSQRMAPALALPRHIRSGNRGLSRVLGEEVEAQISPRAGLYPSDVFPATLYGATQFDSAMMGFSVWQHVFGEPDPETGIRALYTRRWPTWAVQYYRYRRTYVALTDAGPIDILNDGKFTLIADTDEPHFFGAILALAEEALDGVSTRNARASYIDRYGNPKLIATMPQSVGSNSPEGQAMMDALYTLRGPDGFSVVPFGAKIDFVSLAASQSTVMNDAMASNWQNIAATLLGSDGTMTRGTGVYSAPIFAGVRRDLVDRDLRVLVRGINQGHIGTWLKYNYAASIEANRGEWIQPVIDIPLPDPDADARIKSYADRVVKFHEIVAKERANGCVVTQERIDQLAASLEIDPPKLSKDGSITISAAAVEKTMLVKEVRASQNREPLGDERDDLTVAELDAKAKAAAQPEPVGAPTSEAPESEEPIGATEGASSEPAEVTNGAGDSTGGETKSGAADSASAP